MDTISWEEIGHILATLLIVSLFYETALSAIFNWRMFQVYLKDKGVKVPVSITIAVTVFYDYGLDLFTPILTALGHEAVPTYGGIVLTALLVAGGSGGINGLFNRLNIRNPIDKPEPPQKTHPVPDEKPPQSAPRKRPDS